MLLGRKVFPYQIRRSLFVSIMFSILCFIDFWLLWAPLGFHYWWSSIVFASFFSIDSALFFGYIWVSFLMFLLIPFPFVHSTCKDFNIACVWNEFAWFHQSDVFYLALICDELGHRCCLNFGTPLAYKSICFRNRFCYGPLYRMFIDFG